MLDLEARISYILGQANPFPRHLQGAMGLSNANCSKLEALLAGLEREIARNARNVERRALWDAARRYRRSRSWLEDLLPPDILSLALHDRSSPTVTWQVLRHLCRHIRFNSGSQLGNAFRLTRCRTMAAGEVHLLHQQRTARQDRQFVGGMMRTFSQAV